ncbi:MDS1 and EVI1 complex locus protein EVI1 [Liparis tanakae]|uniref:MDS1 and EVI1 complex locus protein EVI1 n=1 Tax=Liparis tanakae TaxID=230148 RepID=A0A4Z2E2Y7_9TELE|nr:MDS1 and EVI1 complex locus protein EVI1 [Liparis tanakae]
MHADCRTQIKCRDCGQMFSTSSSLNKHRRFCEGKRRFAAPWPASGGVSSPLGGRGASGLADYFGAGGLAFPAAPAFPFGFPGLFPSGLYRRPALGAASSPLAAPPPGPREQSDRSESSEPEDGGTPSGSEPESASGSEPDSDTDGEREGGARPGSALAPPSPDERAAVTGAVHDSIKAIASIAERYFGSVGPGRAPGGGARPAAFPLPFFPAFSPPGFSLPDGAPRPPGPEVEPPPEDGRKARGKSSPDSAFDLTTKRKTEKPRPPAPGTSHARSQDQPLDLSLGGRGRGGGAREDETRTGRGYGGRAEIPKADASLQHARPAPFFMDPIYRYYL